MSITTRIQANPRIGTNNSAYVTELIDRVKRFIISQCRLPRWPELSQGYSKSGTGASTDITGLSTNEFGLTVNGYTASGIEVTLAGANTGDLVAAAVQDAIQSDSQWGFDEVTVTWDASATQYTITSGRYGEYSYVEVTWYETYKHVAQALKLSPTWGGTELPGMAYDENVETLAVMLVEYFYRKLGLEAGTSVSIDGDFSIDLEKLPGDLRNFVADCRRIYV